MRPLVRTLLAVDFGGAGLMSVAGAAPALAAGTSTAPPGWVEVDSGPIPIPPGQAGSGGSISCPPGTIPWGGGAFVSGAPDIGEDINSSAPTDVGWTARYNNRTTRMSETFGLDAICANRPPGYTVVQDRRQPGADAILCDRDLSRGNGRAERGLALAPACPSTWSC